MKSSLILVLMARSHGNAKEGEKRRSVNNEVQHKNSESRVLIGLRAECSAPPYFSVNPQQSFLSVERSICFFVTICRLL